MVNNKTPLVSIGMCVYNEGKYIAKSIESILQQDYKNLELIITDNCSQDNTQEICLQYAKKDDRVRYYRYRYNIGVLRTFNFTFELTQGNYFMLAGGHDLWDKSFVGRCVEILNSDDKVVLCYTFGNMIDIDDRYITSLRGVDTRDLTIEERMHLALEQKTNLAICGLMRTEAINKIMPIKYSEIPGGDEVMLLELSTLGTFAYIREPLFYLRKVREEKSEEETITRILKMTNPFREQCQFKTYILDTLESILQVIDKLKINKQYKSSLTTNLVHTLKKRFGERSLKQGEDLGSEIIEKYGNINIEDIDFLTMREAYLALKHINLALLFHPDSLILQEAHHLLIQLNHGSLVDANTALCTRGKQALKSGNINEAIEIYSKVLKTNPIDETALCGLALVYQTDGKMDKTIDAYKKALQVNPSSFDAHYNLAIVYSSTNQIDDAIGHLNKAINLNSSDASVHNNLGVLYFKKNMCNDAKNCFERALLIDAHYKEAQQNLKKVSKVVEKV